MNVLLKSIWIDNDIIVDFSVIMTFVKNSAKLENPSKYIQDYVR